MYRYTRLKMTMLLAAVAVPAQSVCAQSATEVPDTVLTRSLEEVTVSDRSARSRLSSVRLGSETLELGKLSETPRFFGESDIIKSITLLPGVSAEASGAGGFEVRGGNAYQNLVTLDGMTIYNPAHMMGIFSTFNDDAMGRAVLHKGPVPASFGGASSSVLETYMRAGDMSGYHFSGTVGLLNAKVSAEGPVVRDKLSLAVSARRSYVDLFLNLMPEYRGTVMNFFDVNAKLRYDAGGGNILDVAFFAGRDNLAISDLMVMHWGNIAGSINWTVRAGDSWRFVTTAAATDYSTEMGRYIMDVDQSLREYIRSFSLNERALWEMTDGHSLEIGLRSELLRVKSADMAVGSARLREIRSGWQNALWIAYEGSPLPRVKVSAGARLSAFTALAGRSFHKFIAVNETPPDFSARTYLHFEPRASVKYDIADCHNVKAGAAVTTQDLHGVRASTTTFPFDRYALTSAGVRPEVTTLGSAGYAGMTRDGVWDWSAEAYYKSMDHVYDYRDGVNMFSRINLESLILAGKGRSYGLELMLRKNAGRLSGWISYTLSRTQTRIPGINGGQWYNATNDRRHDAAVVAFFDVNARWKLSASWTYSSGRPLTAPDEKYDISGTTCYYYTRRNSYKTPPSHRLDLSATYTRVGRRVTSIWTFGLFNAYAYYSPFVVYFEDDPSKPSGTRAVQRSLFGVVPSVSYTVKF
ncbi:MAG: TonB-dependent receptor plug domain-containing protein [Muribaculaceae bacterium]|nr:TonB-dependent receptor plug domain-containing protein [Muribaculaceae bacterium]